MYPTLHSIKRGPPGKDGEVVVEDVDKELKEFGERICVTLGNLADLWSRSCFPLNL